MKKENNLFEHPFLESLSVSSPKIMIPFHLLIILIFIRQGMQVGITNSVLVATGIFFSGLLTWTLAEYLLHRYAFHFEKEHWLLKKIHYIVHGYHHEEPRDRQRLIMPPLPVSFIILFFWTLFYLFLGQAVWFFLPGFELGYLLYALMHYSIHTFRVSQVPSIIKPLWIHHSLHHHKYPDKAFGVTNRFWDRVFQTMPPV